MRHPPILGTAGVFLSRSRRYASRTTPLRRGTMMTIRGACCWASLLLFVGGCRLIGCTGGRAQRARHVALWVGVEQQQLRAPCTRHRCVSCMAAAAACCMEQRSPGGTMAQHNPQVPPPHDVRLCGLPMHGPWVRRLLAYRAWHPFSPYTAGGKRERGACYKAKEESQEHAAVETVPQQQATPGRNASPSRPRLTAHIIICFAKGTRVFKGCSRHKGSAHEGGMRHTGQHPAAAAGNEGRGANTPGLCVCLLHVPIYHRNMQAATRLTDERSRIGTSRQGNDGHVHA